MGKQNNYIIESFKRINVRKVKLTSRIKKTAWNKTKYHGKQVYNKIVNEVITLALRRKQKRLEHQEI